MILSGALSVAHDSKWRPLYCRYSVDMKVDGFDLIITNAQREDDSEIQCQLQGSDDLIKKVKVTVLGEYTKVTHLVHKGHTLSIHWVLLTTSEIKMILT